VGMSSCCYNLRASLHTFSRELWECRVVAIIRVSVHTFSHMMSVDTWNLAGIDCGNVELLL